MNIEEKILELKEFLGELQYNRSLDSEEASMIASVEAELHELQKGVLRGKLLEEIAAHRAAIRELEKELEDLN